MLDDVKIIKFQKEKKTRDLMTTVSSCKLPCSALHTSKALAPLWREYFVTLSLVWKAAAMA
jgi:hypothetical protein